MAKDRGNVFVFVLLGVIMFAALAFAVTRGLTGGGETLSGVQARNYAIDIITYGGKLEGAVQRLLANGVSERDLSFEQNIVSGYAHSPVVADTAKIFLRPDGLGAQWLAPIGAATAQGSNNWIFTASTTIEDAGDNGLSELMLYLMVRPEVCAALNTQLGLTNINLATSLSPSLSLTKFTGTYADGSATTLNAAVTREGCYRISTSAGLESGSYVYLKPLLIR